MATYAERAMDALSGFLDSELNDTLADLRTALDITTLDLPDIEIIEPWYHRASQSTKFTYMSLVIASSTGESEPNSRFYSFEVDLGLVVLDKDIAGDEAATMVAAWRYGDGIKTLFNRRIGGQGWTLGNASGIIRATVDNQVVGADPSLSAPNVALLTRV